MGSLFALPEIPHGWPIQARVCLEGVTYADVRLGTGSRTGSSASGGSFGACSLGFDGKNTENTVPLNGACARDFT